MHGLFLYLLVLIFNLACAYLWIWRDIEMPPPPPLLRRIHYSYYSKYFRSRIKPILLKLTLCSFSGISSPSPRITEIKLHFVEINCNHMLKILRLHTFLIVYAFIGVEHYTNHVNKIVYLFWNLNTTYMTHGQFM